MMLRRAARTDDNQTEIVRALRKVGCTVAVTSAAGNGFPDLVLCYRGRNILMELKDGSKPPSQRRLTPEQVKFHATWRGPICVVDSIDAALQALENVMHGD